MAMKLRILGSSSSGNCALLSAGRSHVLIDAGLGINTIRRALESCSLALEKIDAVFLTHDHSDHTGALANFKKYAHIPVFANELTAREVKKRLKHTLNWKLFESGQSWGFGELQVQSFCVPHDAQDSVGFIFEHEKKRLGWITDLGYVTELVRDKVRDLDALALESNYEPHLLTHSDRPLALKTRIKGRHGHLSNEQAFEFLDGIDMPRCKHVYLIHVSRECNTVQDALSRFNQGALARNFKVEVVDPFTVLTASVLEIE